MFVTISLLLATACLLPSAGKLLGHPRMRQSAEHFGIRWPRYRLIGVAELAAAAGVLAGLWRHPLGIAAAVGMTLLLIGALITHRRTADSGKEMAPALLGLAITSPTWLSLSPASGEANAYSASTRRRAAGIRRHRRILPGAHSSEPIWNRRR